MAWEVWWALVLGFAISGDRAGVGPARAHRARARRRRPAARRARDRPRRGLVLVLLRRDRDRQVACSRRAPRRRRALAFQFASTNLVWELGLVLWVLIGWQFTLAEFVGGLVLIVLMAVAAARCSCRRAWRRRRASTRRRPTPATSTTAAGESTARWRERLTLGDGVVGRRAQLPQRLADAVEGDRASASCSPASSASSPTDFFNAPLHAPTRPRRAAAVENVLVGPLIAVLSFVCSVGNVPLAAVLWSGGIGFAGVIAFVFADLIVLPIVAIYRKYYGTALRAADRRADVRRRWSSPR